VAAEPVIPFDQDVQVVSSVATAQNRAAMTRQDATGTLWIVHRGVDAITHVVLGIARTIDAAAACTWAPGIDQCQEICDVDDTVAVDVTSGTRWSHLSPMVKEGKKIRHVDKTVTGDVLGAWPQITVTTARVSIAWNSIAHVDPAAVVTLSFCYYGADITDAACTGDRRLSATQWHAQRICATGENACIPGWAIGRRGTDIEISTWGVGLDEAALSIAAGRPKAVAGVTAEEVLDIGVTTHKPIVTCRADTSQGNLITLDVPAR
jgi:hypothetical protein